MKRTLPTLAAAGALLGFGTAVQAQWVLVPAEDNPFAGIASPGIAAIADFDGDGDLDLFMQNFDSVTPFGVRWFENIGDAQNPEFAPPGTIINDNLNFFAGVPLQAADLDGDGIFDVFYANKYGPGIVRFENTGTATEPAFAAGAAIVPAADLNTSGGVVNLTAVDLDGDGFIDFLYSSSYDNTQFFRNNGDNTWTEAALPAGLPADGPDNIGRTFGFADLTGNGLPDAVVGASDSAFVRFFENTGTATVPAFTERTGSQNPFEGFELGLRTRIQFFDIFGDGNLEAIFVSADGMGVLVNEGANASVGDWMALD